MSSLASLADLAMKLTKEDGPTYDKGERFDKMVEEASAPTLAQLFKRAKAKNLIEDEQHYH